MAAKLHMLNTLYHPLRFMAQSRITITKKKKREKREKRLSTDVFILSAWIFAYLCTRAYEQTGFPRTRKSEILPYLLQPFFFFSQVSVDEQDKYIHQ